MSFRLTDLKKSVRKGKNGHVIAPTRLDGRSAAFQVEFVIQHFEQHLGQPRRALDPDAILDFVGDARLGRGLLATLSQWYRIRPRTFDEVLDSGLNTGWRPRFEALGISGPVELRAWLFAAVNHEGDGYLEPEREAPFWQAKARALGVRRDDLRLLTVLDRPEEAILVRTGPRPAAADVVAAYTARAHTTLLRSAREVVLRCAAPASLLERAARAWAGTLEVEWHVHGDVLRLLGHADALGCWTRHGRRVERAALELLALPDLQVREVRGRLETGGKECGFHWKSDALASLGAGAGAPLQDELPGQIEALAAALRRERAGDPAWTVRRPAHVIGAAGGVCLPHLELRHGDESAYLRAGGTAPDLLSAFRGKTHLACAELSPASTVALTFASGQAIRCGAAEVLPALKDWLSERSTMPARSAVHRAA